MDDRAGIGTPGGRPVTRPQHAARDVPTPGMYPLFQTTHGDELCELLTDIQIEVTKTRRQIPPLLGIAVAVGAGVLLAVVAVLIVVLIGLAVVARFEDDTVPHAPDTSEFGMNSGVAFYSGWTRS